MATDNIPNRRPPGVGGGQFAPKPERPRAHLELGPDADQVPTADDGLDGPPLPEADEILGADSDQLWDYVRHTDPVVRQEAAGNPNITAEQCAELADPERQPTSVRAAVARLPYPGIASRAVRDPAPIVRWLAGEGGWDLSDAERARLAGDRDVARVRAVMSRRPDSVGNE